MEVFIDYTDDTIFLGKMASSMYALKPRSEFASDEEFKNNSIACVACDNAWVQCRDHLPEDPLDTLENIVNNYEITGVFCKQEINKENYSIACEAIRELRNALLERRGLLTQ